MVRSNTCVYVCMCVLFSNERDLGFLIKLQSLSTWVNARSLDQAIPQLVSGKTDRPFAMVLIEKNVSFD